MTVRVALAESDYLAREGITRAVESVPSVEIIAVCEDRDSLLREVDGTTSPRPPARPRAGLG
jgi:hypothetical protein